MAYGLKACSCHPSSKNTMKHRLFSACTFISLDSTNDLRNAYMYNITKCVYELQIKQICIKLMWEAGVAS